MIRIGIAISVLLSLWRLWGLDPLVAPADIYRPVGAWSLLGRTPPPDALIAALWGLAWGGTIAMLVGLCSRAATAVSFGASVLLAAISFSGSVSWSHQYNVVFLAQLALLGARCGDALSVDALVRRLRGLPPRDVPCGYQWSIRLVLFAVAMMFVGAALHKIGSGHFTLRWALSDNLRHQLLVRYDLTDLDRPPLVDWLLAESWRYRAAAIGNLISQLSPLLAIVFVRRPWIRALAGAMFVLEILGLGYVMSLWNLHWLPLAAVFVDWDALIARVRPAAAPAPEAPARPSRRLRVYVIAFVLYDLATSLIPRLDQRTNTYPFSAFPMFASIRAKRPYDEHRPYTVAADHYEVIADRPIDPVVQRWFDHGNRGLHLIKDPARLRTRLASVLAVARKRYPDLGIRALRHHVAFFVAPAHPAPARFERHDIAITGEVRADGTFVTALGRLDPVGVVIAPQQLATAGAQLVAFPHDDPTPYPLEGVRVGDRVVVGLAFDPVYIAAELDGRRWLVGWRRERR